MESLYVFYVLKVFSFNRIHYVLLVSDGLDVDKDTATKYQTNASQFFLNNLSPGIHSFALQLVSNNYTSALSEIVSLDVSQGMCIRFNLS